MSDYQVIARKFRPQCFKEVVGQDAIVLTLKNAIRMKRLAQAYLFCGSRGTGKTTLARIFAKALNCQQPTADFEPCNACSSCKEITAGTSLDVLEIDGASHRGIEDIRQINETVGYAAASGHYKIYIIDEVHMLTKEAFNALLKTLEEPPAKVKFFFATTEPHKVLPTILSRCQRFNLSRIPFEKMVAKLSYICQKLGAHVEEEALRLIAKQAEGGLRDAESLLDQILSFEEGKITTESVNSILGLMPRDAYFELDVAGKAGDFAKAFDIAHDVFSKGKDLLHFVEGLTEHFRNILLTKLSGKDSSALVLSHGEKERYEASARLYTQEQCLNLIDYLIEAQNQIRFAPSPRIALEGILLHIMRIHFQLPVEFLVRKLVELEKTITSLDGQATPMAAPASPVQPVVNQSPTPQSTVSPPKPLHRPLAAPEVQVKKESPPPIQPAHNLFISEDPTPSSADLGQRSLAKPAASTPAVVEKPLPPAPMFTTEERAEISKKQSQYDTLFQFAAVELEGKLQKNGY